MNLLENIKLKEKDLSKTERQVAHYILNNPESIEKYTISKLANMCHTSTSAVLRFTQTLGFHGYKDFRFEMVHYLHEQHTMIDSADLLNQLTSGYNKVINQINNIDRQILDNFIEDIKTSDHIYIMGIYYSSLPARLLSMSLQDLGIQSHLSCDYMEAAHMVDNIRNNDLLINFSLTGETSTNNQLLSSLNSSMPEKSYLITISSNAKLSSIYKHTVVLPGQGQVRQSIVDVQSIPMMFVEILINLLHNKL